MTDAIDPISYNAGIEAATGPDAALEQIIAHLGAALIQQSPSDDAIIMGHVRDAYKLACVARGSAEGCDMTTDKQWIIDLIRNEYDKAPALGRAGYPAFDSEWDDGAERIADQILTRLTEPQTAPDDAWQILSCDEQFALAKRIAANVGYVLAPEPAHPDSPHCGTCGTAAPADAERLALAEKIDKFSRWPAGHYNPTGYLQSEDLALIVSSLRAGGWREDMQS